MSLLDLDSWATEYQACDRLSDKIATQLSQQDPNNWQSLEYKTNNKSIQVLLKQFDNELKQLNTKLSSQRSNRNITESEADRRQTNIDDLQRRLIELKYKFNIRQQQNAATSSGSVWQGEGSSNDAAVININDIDLLNRRKNEIIEDQNRGLDLLSETLSRQRNLATQLGREVNEQNDILDNLAQTMDRVDSRVQSTTDHVTVINRRDSTFGYWIVIILLFIAILIVGFI